MAAAAQHMRLNCKLQLHSRVGSGRESREARDGAPVTCSGSPARCCLFVVVISGVMHRMPMVRTAEPERRA